MHKLALNTSHLSSQTSIRFPNYCTLSRSKSKRTKSSPQPKLSVIVIMLWIRTPCCSKLYLLINEARLIKISTDAHLEIAYQLTSMVNVAIYKRLKFQDVCAVQEVMFSNQLSCKKTWKGNSKK